LFSLDEGFFGITASGPDTRVERVRVDISQGGIGVRLLGAGSILTDSVVDVGQGSAVVAGDDTIVRGNRIRGRLSDVVRASSRTKIVDNDFECSTGASCIQVDGAENIVSNNRMTGGAIIIRGNHNHVMDNAVIQSIGAKKETPPSAGSLFAERSRRSGCQ
jgi:hypothetical protein